MDIFWLTLGALLLASGSYSIGYAAGRWEHGQEVIRRLRSIHRIETANDHRMS